MLRTKEHRFISELDKDMDEKTDVLLLQLSSWQQFAEDIKKVIKDAKFAVDDFPRKTTRTVKYERKTSEIYSIYLVNAILENRKKFHFVVKAHKTILFASTSCTFSKILNNIVSRLFLLAACLVN